MTNTQEIAFKKLVKCSKDLKHSDYNLIKQIISDSIKKVPVATAFLKKGSFIERARPNKKVPLFYSEDQISYIKDYNIINNDLTDFGRANKPHQVMFYGAIESTTIPHQRLTAIYETSDYINDKASVNLEGELFTISRWKVIEDICLVEIVFSDEAIKNNPDTKKAFEYHMKSALNHPLRELGLRQIQFFSSEFAKEVKYDYWEYKISVAYTDLVMHEKQLKINNHEIGGITYPSVPSGYKGQNIVIKPSIVDNKLKLESVSTYKLYKNRLNAWITNHKLVVDFGTNNMKFVWKDYDNE